MTKPRIYKHLCKFCNTEYLGADVKGNKCYNCIKKIKCVKCGKETAYGWSLHRKSNTGACSKCYQTMNKGKTRKELIGKHYKCPTKGKTYKQIYGTSNPTCGFNKGDGNIAKMDNIRKKISESVKKSYTPELRKIRGDKTKENFLKGMHFGVLKFKNKIGEMYRSTLECKLSELLIDNNIAYNYEGKSNRIRLYDNTIKVVDFMVDNLIIEITGFAYKKWQDDFIHKIIKLRKTIDNTILILTYDNKVDILKETLKDHNNIIILNIDDSKNVVDFIKKYYIFNKKEKNDVHNKENI